MKLQGYFLTFPLTISTNFFIYKVLNLYENIYIYINFTKKKIVLFQGRIILMLLQIFRTIRTAVAVSSSCDLPQVSLYMSWDLSLYSDI